MNRFVEAAVRGGNTANNAGGTTSKTGNRYVDAAISGQSVNNGRRIDRSEARTNFIRKRNTEQQMQKKGKQTTRKRIDTGENESKIGEGWQGRTNLDKMWGETLNTTAYKNSADAVLAKLDDTTPSTTNMNDPTRYEQMQEARRRANDQQSREAGSQEAYDAAKWEEKQRIGIQGTKDNQLLQNLQQLNELYTTANLGHESVAVPAQEQYTALYNQLKGQYGDQVDDWAEYVKRLANAESMGEMTQRIAYVADESPVVASLATPLVNVASGAGIVDVAAQKLGKTLSGSNTPIDYNRVAQLPSNWVNTTRGTVSQKIAENTDGWIGSDTPVGNLYSGLYNIGMSMADSVVGQKLGGATVFMGGAAATNAMNEARERGASTDQALAMGLLAGVAETVMEKVPMDKLLSQTSPTSVRSAIKNILSQGASEATEEGLTTLANTVSDAIVMGDKSELNTAIRRYRASGYSDDEAQKKAFTDWLIGLAGDAIGGFVSGGLFSAAYNIPGGIDYKRSNAGANADGTSNTQTNANSTDTNVSPVDSNAGVDTDTAVADNAKATDPMEFAVRETMKPTKERQAMDEALQRTADWMNGKENTAAVEGQTESTSVNTDPAEHTPAEQAVIEEYQASVDEDLVRFANEVLNGSVPNSTRYDLGKVSDSAAVDIYREIGVNASGFNTVLEGRMVEHIRKRHGEHGKSDHSMTDLNDLGRIKYVIDNYDSISAAGTSKAYTTLRSDGKAVQAKTVKFKKAVNGTYYVVEAVPDTKAKTTFVISAFMSKDGETKSKVSQTANAKSPDVNVRNGNANTFDSSTLAQSRSNVNQNQQTNFDNDMGAKKSDFEHETKQSKGNTTLDFEETHNVPEAARTNTDYIAVTEAETNYNAKLRLEQDFDGEVEELRRKAAWSAEEMSMGRMILEDLWAEADGTDDWTAYQDWAKVFEAHKEEGGRALQNLAQINRRSGLGIVQEASNILDLSSGKDAKNGRVILDQDNLRQIQDVRDTALRLLENIHEALDPGRDHGVPVEDWTQEIGKQLAKAVSAKPRQSGTKTTAQTIKSDLLRLAKNFLPKKVKSKTRTNIDTLRDYYDNKAMYDEAWDAARKVYAEQKNGKGAFATASLSGPQTGPVIQQAIVEEIVEQELQNRNINIRTQLGDTSGLSAEISRGIISKIDAAPVAALEIRKNVDRYFDGVRREVEKGVTKKGGSKLEGVNKNIQSDIAKTVKNMGRTAADIIRSGNQSKAETGAAIASALVSQYGVSTQNARTAANMIVDRFNQYVAQQSEKALQQRFKPKDKKAKKTFEQDLGELINMGAFTNANWADIVSKKMFGQSVTIDPQLLQEYRNAKNQKSRDAVIEKIKDDVGSKIPWGEAKKLLDEAKKSVDSGKVLGAVSQKAKQYDRAVRHKDVDGLVQLIKDTAAERNTGYRIRKDGTQKQSGYLNWALDRIAGYAKSGELTGNVDPNLSINASNIQNPDVAFRFLQDFASTGILNIAADTKKVSKATQLMALRRSGMLSKFSTFMRNFESNGGFNIMDTIARDISVPLDMLISNFTGTRSTSVDYGYLSKAARQGSLDNIAIASLETSLDVNGRNNGGKYTAGGQRTFKMSGNVVERFFSQLEALQGYEMYVTDEMSKGRTQAEVQRGTDKLYEQGKIRASDDSLRDAGTQTALYRTFQDESSLSNATLKTRDALNEFHAGDVGAGDVLMPFAQVPANLVDRSIDYSPAGLAKTTGKLVEALSKAKKGEFTAADQARVVQSLGRNITGTAMIAIATALAVNGLIRVENPGDEDENKDKTAFERMQGQTGTQWNLSATLRKMSGGDPTWQDDDVLMSIAFLEPMNAQLTIGALLAEAMEQEGQLTAETAFKKSFTGALAAIKDLPMFDTIGDAIDAYKYSPEEQVGDKLWDAGETLLANEVVSIIPNWMKGIAQGLDPYQRDLYSKDDTWGQVGDQFRSVFDRKSLPVKQDNFGRDMTNEGGVLNFLNTNILPGYITKYHTDPLTDEITRIAEETGSNSVYPSRKAPDELSIDGEKVPLSYEEKQQYQKTYGNTDEAIRTGLMESEAYGKLTTEEKEKAHQYSEDYAKQVASNKVNEDYDMEDWVAELQGKSESEIVEAVLYKTFSSLVTGKEYANKYDGMADLVDQGKLSDAMAITMMPEKMKAAYQNVAKAGGVSVDEWLDMYAYAYPSGKKETGGTDNEKIRNAALEYIDKQSWGDSKKTAAASAIFQFLTDTIPLQQDVPYDWALNQGDSGLDVVVNNMSDTQKENYEKYIQGHFDNDKMKLYLDVYKFKGTAKSDKDEDGKITYSAQNKVIDYIDSLEGLTNREKIRIFLGLDYSEKKIPYWWYD